MRRVVTTPGWAKDGDGRPLNVCLGKRDYRLMRAVVRAADDCFNKRGWSSPIKDALDAFNAGKVKK